MSNEQYETVMATIVNQLPDLEIEELTMVSDYIRSIKNNRKHS